MLTSSQLHQHPGNPINRETLLSLLQAAKTARHFRFGREIALTWLATYPSDLQVNFFFAQFLVEDNRPEQANKILERLYKTDPEFIEAYELQIKARRQAKLSVSPDLLASALSLGSHSVDSETTPSWGRNLYVSRTSLEKGDLDNAHKTLHLCLSSDPPSPIIGITHLKLLQREKNTPPAAIHDLAEHYHQHWSDCLAFDLFLADSLMVRGESDRAVALLHQVAANDISGQVVDRIWDSTHPYLSLWPRNLEIPFDLPVPASVAAILGWNLLDSGTVIEPSTQAGSFTSLDSSPPREPQTDSKTDKSQFNPKAFQDKEEIREIREALEKVAVKLNRQDTMRMEGRFPVYVILSTRKGLEKILGQEKTTELITEMSRLAKAFRNRKGWDAIVLLADDSASTGPLGIKPANPENALELKLRLADLDSKLGKKGEMIGAVLIVGGPEIVPFHLLPNPVEDDDENVPSDNPYSTRDENYFVPEWPVGRLPNGMKDDQDFLLKSLRKITSSQPSQVQVKPQDRFSLNRFINWFRINKPNLRIGKFIRSYNLGYSAEVWRHASSWVFRPIGEPRSMLISPPVGVNGNASQINPISRLTGAQLGYFNLHGLSDSSEWFGQRDPLNTQAGPDYPVALRPEDLPVNGVNNRPSMPEVVFSEACYGAHILNKPISQSMALKFLEAGTQGFAGSTTISYGSINAPLIGADLLGQLFWNQLREGQSTGEALRRAKINLAKEMHLRQGYLDGEDQKTLISFVLYGDPLTQTSSNKNLPKNVHRSLRPPLVRTICDRDGDLQEQNNIPQEIITHVKLLVSEYLPDMQDAKLLFSQEKGECKNCSQTCPTSRLKSKAYLAKLRGRRLVTISKQYSRGENIYHQFARMTLDESGKLVKLVVSR